MTLHTEFQLTGTLESYELYSKKVAEVADQVMKVLPAASKLRLLSFDLDDLSEGSMEGPDCWRQCFIQRRSNDVQRAGNDSKVLIQIERGLARRLVPESQVIDSIFECEGL